MQNILAIINRVILKRYIRANSSYLRNEKQLHINIAPTKCFPVKLGNYLRTLFYKISPVAASAVASNVFCLQIKIQLTTYITNVKQAFTFSQ